MFIWDENDGIRLISTPKELDYIHRSKIIVPSDLSAYDVYCQMTDDTSLLLKYAFKMRDTISALAGVKKIKGFSATKPRKPPIAGEYLDFFLVEFISNDEISLTSRDKHLSVMLSIKLKDNETDNNEVFIATSVITHNLFGKLYMLPVAPAHNILARRVEKKFAL